MKEVLATTTGVFSLVLIFLIALAVTTNVVGAFLLTVFWVLVLFIFEWAVEKTW